MKYKVTKNGEVVKNNMSKKQAEEYCEKMNQDFMDSQEKIRKQQHKSGLPLRKNKYELYKVEVVKENVIKLTEDDLTRIVKQVINESSNEEDVKGKKCESCGKGTYKETEPMDDLRGTLHCSKCDKMVDRYKKYTPFKKKSNKLSESNLVKTIKKVISERIKVNKDERIKLTNNEKFLLVIPLTERSSCKYGSSTKWCVSGKENNKFGSYKKMCHTVGMIMIKDPIIQESLETSKFAINVWGNNIEIYNELNKPIMNFGKILRENGFENEMREVFNDFINYHNSICDNKVKDDYFDRNINR